MSMMSKIIFLLLLITVRNVCVNLLKSLQKKIVGGKTTHISNVPYTVAIFDDKYICVGSYIKPVWILTVAHCLEAFPSARNIVGNPRRLILRMGITSVFDRSRQKRRSVSLLVHENYANSRDTDDIGLIKITKPFALSKDVALIKLPEERITYRNQNVTVAGWGYQTFAGIASTDALRYVDLVVFSDLKCEKLFGSGGYKVRFAGRSILCAGHDKGGKDACLGDSGAALVLRSPKMQIGIVSWGVGCGDIFPGVYTDVYSYKEWIHNNTITYNAAVLFDCFVIRSLVWSQMLMYTYNILHICM